MSYTFSQRDSHGVCQSLIRTLPAVLHWSSLRIELYLPVHWALYNFPYGNQTCLVMFLPAPLLNWLEQHTFTLGLTLSNFTFLVNTMSKFWALSCRLYAGKTAIDDEADFLRSPFSSPLALYGFVLCWDLWIHTDLRKLKWRQLSVVATQQSMDVLAK